MKCTPLISQLITSNRLMMRDCAIRWRHARHVGDLATMTQSLLFATLFRNLNQGYREAL